MVENISQLHPKTPVEQYSNETFPKIVPGLSCSVCPPLPPPTDRPVIIYTDGCFDLLHLGHFRQIEQAKKAFPNVHLIVGVSPIKQIHEHKGLTVQGDDERVEALRHVRWVDEIIFPCPWNITPEFLEHYKIDYVCHDESPYESPEGATADIYFPIKSAGKFLASQRTPGVSTTGQVEFILRRYNAYIERSIKRGCTPKDLNISVVDAQNILMSQQILSVLKETQAGIKTLTLTEGPIGSQLEQKIASIKQQALQSLERIFKSVGVESWDKVTEPLNSFFL